MHEAFFVPLKALKWEDNNALSIFNFMISR